jgi:hypothetical protein
MEASRRLSILRKHVEDSVAEEPVAGHTQEVQMLRQPCAAKQTVDPHTMECFLDGLRSVKASVYKAFAERPDLLVPTAEGLTKEAHRALVRDSLRCLLNAGYQPLQLFDTDIARYFYMAEVCAPIDLSLVRSDVAAPPGTACDRFQVRIRASRAQRRANSSAPTSVEGVLTWSRHGLAVVTHAGTLPHRWTQIGSV